MAFRAIVVSVTLSVVGTSNEPVRLDFLKAIPRLHTSEYTDYFFSCNVVGHFLQWTYNNETLTTFGMDDQVGHSLVRERLGYTYTGTLLSSEPVSVGNDARAMDSIIVVSFRLTVPASFEVTCSNGSHSNTTRAGRVTSVTNSSIMHDNNTDVVLEYITTHKIVRNTNTHLFICGVNHSHQFLQANGQQIAFRSREQLGIHRVASATEYAVNELGILIAREPFSTVSILIVAHDTDIEVACFYENVMERIHSNIGRVEEIQRIPEPVGRTSTSLDTTSSVNTNTEPTTTTSTIATLLDSTDGKVSSSRNRNIVYAGIVVAVVFSIVVILAVLFAFLIVFKECPRTEEMNQEKSSSYRTIFWNHLQGQIQKNCFSKMCSQQSDAESTAETAKNSEQKIHGVSILARSQ